MRSFVTDVRTHPNLEIEKLRYFIIYTKSPAYNIGASPLESRGIVGGQKNSLKPLVNIYKASLKVQPIWTSIFRDL